MSIWGRLHLPFENKILARVTSYISIYVSVAPSAYNPEDISSCLSPRVTNKKGQPIGCPLSMCDPT